MDRCLLFLSHLVRKSYGHIFSDFYLAIYSCIRISGCFFSIFIYGFALIKGGCCYAINSGFYIIVSVNGYRCFRQVKRITDDKLCLLKSVDYISVLIHTYCIEVHGNCLFNLFFNCFFKLFIFKGNRCIFGQFCPDFTVHIIETQLGFFNDLCNNTIFLLLGFDGFFLNLRRFHITVIGLHISLAGKFISGDFRRLLA